MMTFRFSIVLTVALFATGLLAPSASAQSHGMRPPAAAPRMRNSFRIRGGAGLAHSSERRIFNHSGFLFPPYFYPDEFDNEADLPEAPPESAVLAQPAPSPAPAVSPVEPLLLENHDGQWVRVPTGSQLPVVSQSAQTAPAPGSIPHPGYAELAQVAPPVPKLPAAIIVFRDGHMEEMGKYLIQGDFLYTNADYWSTGSWTRKIPLSELDVPASLKLNKDRGAKFNLPSAPNEVVIRF
jgi:hypothetical protein